MPKPNHIAYMDLFRGLAILLVILSHLPSPLWFVLLVKNATVFFIFIAGFFYEHLFDDRVSTLDFFQKKACRLAIPYVICAMPAILWVSLSQYHTINFAYTIKSLATGIGYFNDMHWFMPFILLVFSLHPALRILRKSERALYVVTAILMLLSLFTFRSAWNANPLLNLIHFAPTFLFGIVFGRNRQALETFGMKHRWVIIGLSLASYLLVLPLTVQSMQISMESIIAQRVISVNFILVGKLLLIPPLLLLFKHMADANWKPRALLLLAQTSFGLFFLHGYVMHLMKLNPPFDIFPEYQAPLWVTFGQLLIILGVLLPALLLTRKILGKQSVLLTGY